MQACRLQHPPLVLPDEVYFSRAKCILAEESNNPCEELSLIGIVKVVVIIVCVLIVVYTLFDVLYVGHCSDFACGLVKEHLPCILDHQLPIDFVESFP